MDKEQIKILLVEDDEDDYIMTRDLISEIEGANFKLEWVKTHDEALKVMDGNKHDVYLFDYRLGEVTGLELLRKVEENGCKAPVIMLTGQGDKEIDMEAMKAGAADYLVKGQINAGLLERSIRYAIERKKSEEQIRHMAYYDNLTSLPNRTLFKDRLKLAMAHCRRYNRQSALLFLDLDNFKRVNDTFGHTVGDLLLKEVAERLNQSVRISDSVARNIDEGTKDTVARLGGDEFIILLTEIAHPHDAAKVAKRILEVLSPPLILDGHEVFIRVSIGIAIYPLDGEDIESLLKNSDAAMYHAKSSGKNNYQFYRKSMNAAALDKLTLENSLHRALERGELLLYYQPQIDLRKGKITGMEALMRWQHPEKGMIQPSEFIPIAEETGLIIPMSEWLLNTACVQNKAWQEEGLGPVRISVNLSAQQFKQDNLVHTVSRALNNSGLAPGWLELEITENIIMQNTQATLDTLHKLKGMGLNFAMDDFGTGYSSFAYLKKFPLDLIKIDQSFVKDITANPDSAAIVTAIIAMTNSLKLSVIAEGVETEQQQTFLLEHGCYKMQGYLYSRPLPADEAGEFIRNNTAITANMYSLK